MHTMAHAIDGITATNGLSAEEFIRGVIEENLNRISRGVPCWAGANKNA